MLNLSASQIFFNNSYVGNSTKLWNRDMSYFLIGQKNNIFFFKINYTVFLVNKSLLLLKNLKKEKKLILVIMPKNSFLFFKVKKNYSEYKFNSYNVVIINKYVPGIITNFNLIFKKKKKWRKKGLMFKPGFWRVPDILIVLEDSNKISILQESFRFNVLSVHLANTNNSPFSSDYCIPSNNYMNEVLLFFFSFFFNYLYFLDLLNLKFFIYRFNKNLK